MCNHYPKSSHNTWATYNAFNVYCRELAPGTVSLAGDRAQGDDSKHCAYSSVQLSHMMNLKIKFAKNKCLDTICSTEMIQIALTYPANEHYKNAYFL